MKLQEQDEWVPLFDIWRQRIEKLIQEHPLQIISWEATRRCNLKCHHCGSPSEAVNCADELTTSEVVSAFEQIASDFDMSRFRHINITVGAICTARPPGHSFGVAEASVLSKHRYPNEWCGYRGSS